MDLHSLPHSLTHSLTHLLMVFMCREEALHLDAARRFRAVGAVDEVETKIRARPSATAEQRLSV